MSVTYQQMNGEKDSLFLDYGNFYFYVIAQAWNNWYYITASKNFCMLTVI